MQNTPKAFFAILFTLALAATSHAQIGGGWIAESKSGHLQQEGDVYYNNSNGTETFRLNTSTSKRCEIMLDSPRWSSGSHQFEGYVTCTGTPRSAGNSVQQIFGATLGSDASMVRYYSSSGGTLKTFQDGVTLATGIYGVRLRLNVIHYRSTGKIEHWINGSKKDTHDDAGAGSYYFKYGMYIAGSSGKPQAQWSSIRVWKK